MHDGHFKTVAIVGVGLLGASLGLALKRRHLATRVIGVGRKGSVSIKTALARGAIDVDAPDVVAGVVDADLIVLCTPVRQFPGLLATIGPHLKHGAVITDVGSTKADVMRWARETLPEHAVFIGSHPMAGSEKSGPEAAREDLYEGAVCLLTSDPPFDPAKLKRASPTSSDARVFRAAAALQNLWQAVGMRTIFLGAAEHDSWVATISHLPHAVAGCLVKATARQPDATEAAAGGFLDSTRIASGDVDMWTDIFMTNRGPILEAIDGFEKELASLKRAVATGAESDIRQHLMEAKSMRDKIMHDRAQRAKSAGSRP